MKWLLPLLLTPSLALAVDPCSKYLVTNANGESVGVTRIESLFGRMVQLIDLTDGVEERTAASDSALRVINLKNALKRGMPVMGFGRPNVYTALPIPTESGDQRYGKVAAKSFRMGDTRIEPTRGNIQSGVLVLLPDADQAMVDTLFNTARTHEGRRGWTCVNLNCQIWADAGFTVGGESLRRYYFPVALLRDIVRYGLEYRGQPVRVDFLRTTPQYLEDVGLSINHAVFTTLCRHARRACETGALARYARHPFLVRLDDGTRRAIGVGFLPAPRPGTAAARARLESKPSRMRVAPVDERRYTLKVTEPSKLGTAFRMLWGPHTVFEIALDPAVVDRHLPLKLRPFPQSNPNFVTRVKKRLLIAPFVTAFINSHLKASVRTFTDLTQEQLFDMLRTDSPALPNTYNFVVTGTSLLITKNNIRFETIDWYLSKHLVVSNYNPDVRLGGTTWKDEVPVVHLSGDSGSYRPDDPAVYAGADLFREVFPGVPVRVVESPRAPEPDAR